MVGIKETAILGLIPFFIVLSLTRGEDGIQDLYESISDTSSSFPLLQIVENDREALVSAILRSPMEFLHEYNLRTYNDAFPLDRKLQYLLETKRSINGIKNLIDELQNRLEKRTACALDGGMSASCNHKDAVEAGAHHRFLASSFAPGRRKRKSSFQPIFKNLNFNK